MKKRLLIILSVFLIIACTMPDTRIYSLYIPDSRSPRNPEAAAKSDASLVMLINSPKYLAQSYIVYRNSPYQLEISRYSKWESSPRDMVRLAFQDSLPAAGCFRTVRTAEVIPDDSYYLEINLRKLERSDEETKSFGVLEFDAVLNSPGGSELYRTSIAKKVSLSDASFLSLAKGLSGLLSEGVREVNDGLTKACKR
jgi:uncharacterized lipoprotein YmbA